MTRSRRLLLLLVPVFAFAFHQVPGGAAQDAPAPFPPGTSGEFVSLALGTGDYFRVNASGCATRFPPYSTFKIPNSLIGLETGVVTDTDVKWRWDAAKYPLPASTPGGQYASAWQQDNSLRSALSNSVVWYYRELATRIGERRMKDWLSSFRYGNQDISGGLDRFWLGSSLHISPDEQVEFLAKLDRGAFPVSPRNLATVKTILTQEATVDYKLIAKTGSSAAGEGWLVGWVEKPHGGCVFALHMKADAYGEMTTLRPQLARRFLRQAGCLPQEP